jgi:cytochrome c oxidase subunit 1/cytochrome c oxidase subunit I+III
VTTIGAFILAAGVLVFIANIVMSRRHGMLAGPNPWDGPSLEWTTPSPPPPYNFAVIPAVASRHPLWEERLHEGLGHSSIGRGLVLDNGKEVLATTTLDALPDTILKMPEDSIAPLVTAIVLTGLFAALLVHLWWLAVLCGLLTLASLAVWLWPEPELGQIAALPGD